MAKAGSERVGMRTWRPWLLAKGWQVEAIRQLYHRCPATTAAGLARRFNLPLQDAVAAVMGGWFGLDGLTPARAHNLAAARVAKYDDGRWAARVICKGVDPRDGRFVLEKDLATMSFNEALAHRDRVEERATRERKRKFKGRRQRRFEQHVATYAPLVGATKRAANARRRETKQKEEPK